MTMYELAYQLKMPVYLLRQEMPFDEVLGWNYYFSQRPVGWRDDNRTMSLLQAQGVKAKPEEIFASLAMIRKSQESENITEDGRITAKGLAGSGIFMKMMGASHGDKLPILDQL